MSAKSNITSEQFEKQYMNYVNNRDKIYKDSVIVVERAQYICKLKDQLHNKNGLEIICLFAGLTFGFLSGFFYGWIL